MNNAFDGVIFKLHGIAFAVDALKVRGVVGGAVWAETGSDGQSSIETRGKIVPVVDLRKLFGFPSLEKSGLNSFIALQAPGPKTDEWVALWVDSLLDMIHVAGEDLRSLSDLPEGIPADHLRASVERDGVPIYILKTDEILRESFLKDRELDKAAS